MDPFRLITLDPGHFHAALIQKEMYEGVSPRVAVYAPLSPDLTEHLNRIARFNQRSSNPTRWELDIHASPDYRDRMVADRPGNIVVLSGRNRTKIHSILRSLEAGLHVLADKPWIIEAADQPLLSQALTLARQKGLIAYDIMTERYEITSLLQRELVNDADVFGAILPGTAQEPAVYMESVHHILKQVAGVTNLRPAWFFDVREQGEALADVGTHLVDLVNWTLFSGVELGEILLAAAHAWPTHMTAAQFQQVTGEAGTDIDYRCNTSVTYAVQGIHTKLDVLWRWEAPAGTGDTHLAIYRGSKSRVEVRQGKDENYRPELYVVPQAASVPEMLNYKIDALSARYPGLAIDDRGAELRVTIPDTYRVGHEAHFAQVAKQFFEYLERPASLPVWEQGNMLAKYFVTTAGVQLSRG